MYQPLDVETMRVLSAMHMYRDSGRVAEHLGMRHDQVRKMLRRSERAHLEAFRSDGRGLSLEGLELIRASHAYHSRMGRFDEAPQPSLHLPTVRLAAVGSGYYGLAQRMATANQFPMLLHLFEETPAGAVRRLDVGEVDAAYVWEDSADITHSYQRRLVASERLMLAMTHERADQLGRTPARADLSSVAWATTPSGMPLITRFLNAVGVEKPTVKVVDCVLTLSGLVHAGEVATLVSPLSLTTGLVKVRPPIDVRRDLVLLTDHKGIRCVDRLHSDLQHTFRTLSQQRFGVVAEGTRLPSPPPPIESTHGTGTQSAVPANSLTDDDLQQLRAVRDAGSVNRAAKALALSQPALSRRITRMESKAAARLIVRRSTGSSLSPAALRILQQADLATQEFHRRLNVRA